MFREVRPFRQMTKPWMIKAGQNKSDQGAFIHTRNAVTIAQDKEDFMIVDSEQGR